jgi:hypothetical protein
VTSEETRFRTFVTTASSSPSPRSRIGSRRRGKKGRAQVEAGYLDWALADFPGYLAADELYDGPFCVLSAVDARRQRRLLYEVLDHDPTQADILLFLARRQETAEFFKGPNRPAFSDEDSLKFFFLAESFFRFPCQGWKAEMVAHELAHACLFAMRGEAHAKPWPRTSPDECAKICHEREHAPWRCAGCDQEYEVPEVGT